MQASGSAERLTGIPTGISKSARAVVWHVEIVELPWHIVSQVN
jgi:hypothetical protein